MMWWLSATRATLNPAFCNAGRPARRARTALPASGHVNGESQLVRGTEFSDQGLQSLAQVRDRRLRGTCGCRKPVPPVQTRPLDAGDSVRVRHVAGMSWPRRTCDDLQLVGLKLVFLIVTRAVSLLGLSRRESWWKDAEILMLRHQLAVAEREHPRAHSRVTWPDRAWLALLAGTVPIGR